MSGGNKNEAGEIIFTNLKICKILQKLSRLLFCFFFFFKNYIEKGRIIFSKYRIFLDFKNVTFSLSSELLHSEKEFLKSSVEILHPSINMHCT